MARIIKNLFPGGKNKVLTFSYDDGHVEDRRLIEIFNRYGIKATFNLVSDRLGDPTYIKADEVAGLFQGHEVAVHTLTHRHMEYLDHAQATREVLHDRNALEELVKAPVRGMAYPYGTYSTELLSIIKACGIAYARATAATVQFKRPDNFLIWNPTCHHADERLPRLTEEFLLPSHHSRIFYIWGHSYEFERQGNWAFIEQYCKEIGEKSEIWYATNIEIYDYLQAVDRLIISVSEKWVYNPSASTVWITVGDEVLCIEGGKIISL